MVNNSTMKVDEEKAWDKKESSGSLYWCVEAFSNQDKNLLCQATVFYKDENGTPTFFLRIQQTYQPKKYDTDLCILKLTKAKDGTVTQDELGGDSCKLFILERGGLIYDDNSFSLSFTYEQDFKSEELANTHALLMMNSMARLPTVTSYSYHDDSDYPVEYENDNINGLMSINDSIQKSSGNLGYSYVLMSTITAIYLVY